MVKHLTMLWSVVKKEALFLWHYRNEKRRREETLSDLEIQMKIAQIELAFAMRADAKVRRK